MKVYKTKIFEKWVRKERITETQLSKALDEIFDGLIDAHLGGGLIKKRIAKEGQGKRGSYRVLLAFKHKERAFFLTGFSKNERENIDPDEKIVLKKLCEIYLNADLRDLDFLCMTNKLSEIKYEKN